MRRLAGATGLSAALTLITMTPTATGAQLVDPSATPDVTPPPATYVLDRPGRKSFGGWTELGRYDVIRGDDTELYFQELVGLGDRLVLLTIRTPIEGGSSMVAPWYSDDGVSWTEAEMPAAPRRVTDLASSPGGVVAVGVSGTRDQRRGTIWTTADGVEWMLATAPPIPMITRIVRTDPLTVLGSGRRLWTTSDGETWEDLGRYPAYSVESGASGYLSAGGGGQDVMGPTELWRSPDGRSWSHVRLPKVLQGGHPAFGGIQVLSVGRKWVLIPADKTPGWMFVSTNGKRWRQVPRPSKMVGDYVYWIERIGDHVQAFGYDDRNQSRLWTWRLGRTGGESQGLHGHTIGAPVRWRDGYVAIGSLRNGPLVLWRWAVE